MIANTSCPICHSTEIYELKHSFRQAMRSDGVISDHPLRKFQCMHCGVGFGTSVTDELPYHRSDGSSIWQMQRHLAIAKGLIDVIRKYSGSEGVDFLEVGAANWETSRQVAESEYDWNCSAIEPFPESNPPTDAANLHCYVEKLPKEGELGRFDVIFSNNVIEHVASSTEFIAAQKKSLKEDGVLVICCPASNPVTEEFLFDDHLFHFTQQSFFHLCKEAEMEIADHFRASWDINTQVFILAHPQRCRAMGQRQEVTDIFLKSRKLYLAAWDRENLRIANQIMGRNAVLFGAGEFAQLMQAYMPDAVASIREACATSLKGARDIGLKLRELDEYDGIKNDLLLAVNSNSRKGVIEMLKGRGVPHESIIYPDGV